MKQSYGDNNTNIAVANGVSLYKEQMVRLTILADLFRKNDCNLGDVPISTILKKEEKY